MRNTEASLPNQITSGGGFSTLAAVAFADTGDFGMKMTVSIFQCGHSTVRVSSIPKSVGSNSMWALHTWQGHVTNCDSFDI